jgi:hypothetical protein
MHILPYACTYFDSYLIKCATSQSTNVLMVYFSIFFLQWAIWLAYCINIMEFPLLQIKITLFT